MPGRGKVQQRVEAVKQVFAESPGSKFTLREVLDALCASGYEALFRVSANIGKRGVRRTKNRDADAGSQSEDTPPAKKRSTRSKSEARLNNEARLRRVRRCIEVLESGASTDPLRPVRSTYLIRSTRMNAGRKEVVWSASKALEDEFRSKDLETFSGWVALRAVRDLLGWVMPQDVQDEVEFYLAEAEDKFGDLKTTSYTARWLSSLVLRPAAYHYFMTQHVDRCLKATIEKAITLRKKVRLTLDLDPDDYSDPWGGEPNNVSISHYVLTLPDIPEILVCPHYEGMDDFGNRADIIECLRIPLSKIKDAVLLDESAEFRGRYDEFAKNELAAASYGENVRAGEMDVAELRIAPWLMSLWTGTWIHKNLKVIGVDPEGWSVCRLEYPRPRQKLHAWNDFGDDLFDFLGMYSSSVEILSPSDERERFKSGAIAEAERYLDGNDQS